MHSIPGPAPTSAGNLICIPFPREIRCTLNLNQIPWLVGDSTPRTLRIATIIFLPILDMIGLRKKFLKPWKGVLCIYFTFINLVGKFLLPNYKPQLFMCTFIIEVLMSGTNAHVFSSIPTNHHYQLRDIFERKNAVTFTRKSSLYQGKFNFNLDLANLTDFPFFCMCLQCAINGQF